MLAPAPATEPAPDTGLASLVLMLHHLGTPADPEQLRHRLGSVRFGVSEILRCARDLGLKARAVKKDWQRLVKSVLPAIAERHDGGFVIVAKAADDKVL